ncbi:hypothetical protein RHSIM_Rhsim01G0085000 [Rhododendron simsii]|uniref:Integrase catalytic domain-containing protein n=1 Tax=Rhododendron simsii TaxID=118357 RepID=A0A834HEI3_RHOSS|nr:hypothetical protein RHSIM_Rhsim01G0085000 [Rhododendron simsii]
MGAMMRKKQTDIARNKEGIEIAKVMHPSFVKMKKKQQIEKKRKDEQWLWVIMALRGTRNQLPTDVNNGNNDNNSANTNGGNDANGINIVNPDQRIPESGQPNGPEIESIDLVQQFARVLNDPEIELAKMLMAMFKAAMAQNQPTVEVLVNVNVNPGQTSGYANRSTEVPSAQVFNNPIFETIFTGMNRIPNNVSNGQNQSFYQSIPTTVPIGTEIENNGNNAHGGQNVNANIFRNDNRNIPNMANGDPNLYGYDPPNIRRPDYPYGYDIRPQIPVLPNQNGTEFRDLFDFTSKAIGYEAILMEREYRKSKSFGTYYQDIEGDVEIDVAQVIGKAPIVCDTLTKAEKFVNMPSSHPNRRNQASFRQYSFDLSKADQLCDEEIKSGEEIIAEKEYNGTYAKGSIRFNTMGSNDLQIYVGPKLIFEGEDAGIFIPSESLKWYGEDDGPFLFKGYPVIPALPGKPDTSMIYSPLFMNERGRGFYPRGARSRGRLPFIRGGYQGRMVIPPNTEHHGWDPVRHPKFLNVREFVPISNTQKRRLQRKISERERRDQQTMMDATQWPEIKARVVPNQTAPMEQKAEFKKSLKKKMEEFQQVLLEDDEDDDLLSVNNKHPFKADTNNVEAGLYDEDLWPIKFEGSKVKSVGVSLTESQFLKYITDGIKEVSKDFVRPNIILRKLEADEPISCNWADCVVDDSLLTLKELTMEDLKAAPAKLDDYKAEVKDPLEDFNVGTEGDPRILHVCVALPDEMKDRLKYLLSEFKDCFAWDYPDMPGLNRSLVEHKIPIKEDFVPYQQIPRQMTPEVQRELQHVYRLENGDANQMAQIASGIRIPEGQNEKLIRVQKRFLPSSIKRVRNDVDVMELNLIDDWRVPIRKFLKNPNEKTDRNIKLRAINYILMGDDLFRKSSDEALLLCITKPQTMTVMGKVHEGTCGSHQSGEKMKWLLKRYGYYWPTIRKDCISYAKGCQKYQQYGPIQRVPAFPLQSIVKPWPFRGWAIDMIGEIIPHSSQQHEYVIVATDYFTKWTEAIPLKSVAQKQVIDFIDEYIFCRFGIPETITVDQTSVFNGQEVMAYVNSYGVKILNSSPYYAQANGQVESTNKIIKNILSKMITDNPREWHDLLPKVLWAYRTSKRDSTRATPYELVYGQAAVLPVEINVISHRIARHYDSDNFDFEEAMYQELGGLEESRIDALNNIQAQKKNIEKAYNKRVHEKSFVESDLVWKAILPLDKKKKRYFGKWSPNWEGPFRVLKVLRGGAYQLESILGAIHERTINGKYLKAYFPSP